MKLYELSNELSALEAQADEWAMEHDGDITDFPLLARLEELPGEMEAKALSLGCWVKNLAAEAEAIAGEARKLQARKKAADNRIENIKAYLAQYVPAGQKMADARCKIGWRKSESVSVVNVAALPEQYQKVEVTAMKVEIKADMKAGKEVPGASIEIKMNIQIS